MKLSNAAKKIIEDWRLGFVASVSAAGRPNLSPKGTFVVLDDFTIAFGEIRSPQTITNIALAPEVEVNFVDQFTRKGTRIRGNTMIVRRGTKEFDILIPFWKEIWGDLTNRIKAIVKIEIMEIKPLTTPLYDDGVTEKEMIELYKEKFSKLHA